MNKFKSLTLILTLLLCSCGNAIITNISQIKVVGNFVNISGTLVRINSIERVSYIQHMNILTIITKGQEPNIVFDCESTDLATEVASKIAEIIK